MKRYKRARERAGLSEEQAGKLLGQDGDFIRGVEDGTEVVTPNGNAWLAALYGVSIPWLLGEVPQYDYDAMKDVPGWDDLTDHDRDVVAEFAATLWRKNE